MAIISGTTVSWELSPRIITIPAPLTEVTINDLQDTLQDLEDSEAGIVWPHLRNTSGGEDLGGGVSVGLTMELQNARLAFEARSTPDETGTATSTGTETLVDTTALFVTNGINPGAMLINYTDGSISTVISVTNETTLIHQTLQGGTNNDWTIGDSYSVTNEVQCSIDGGNLVAVDGVGASLDPVFPTVGTQVIRTSASSATLQNQEQLQTATFIGKEGLGVSVSPLNGTDSIVYPVGIRETPCKTITNAHDIAEDRGFRNIYVMDSITITENMNDGYTFFGDNPQNVAITVDTGVSLAGAKFQDCQLSGPMTSSNIIWESIVGSITNANGFIYKSTIVGPIVVGDTLSMEDCWTATPGTDNVIDFNSTANTVGITDWSGGTILVKNMVTGCTLGMGGTAGSLKLDSSCTGGSVNHGGAIRIKEDLSTGVSINDASTATQVWNKQVEGTFTAEEVMQIMSAALAGKASGLDSNNPVFRDINDTKNRITATTDANGNRTAVTVVGG